MRKFSVFFALLFLATFAQADEGWLGIYLQGQKIGYTHYTEAQTELRGVPAMRRDSITEITTGMLGSALKLSAHSASWFDAKGNMLETHYDMESQGRKISVKAVVSGSKINAVMVTNGAESKKTLDIPEGAVLTDDPTIDFLTGKAEGKKKFYVFAADSMQLLEVEVESKGKTKVSVDAKEYDALELVIRDPRATTTGFFSSKGDLIKFVGPFGMEMKPLAKEKALADEGGSVRIADLASASAIVPDKPVSRTAKSMSLLFTSGDLSRLPSDEHQKVSKVEGGYRLDIGPILKGNRETLISLSAKDKPDWVKPDTRVPSESKEFKDLASEIVGSEKRTIPAAQKLRRYVQKLMGVNAGIGVMRDASEILKTKEGVCRDHAILLGTLTKSAGIPTRFANGIVWSGREFLYHAWVEVWDGEHWIGLDSTVPEDHLTVTHIKTSLGTVDEAQTGFIIEGAKVKVLEIKGS